MATLVQIAPTDTVPELIEALMNLNAEAKKQQRRGRTGTLALGYEVLHDDLSEIVDTIRLRIALGLD